MVAPAKLYKYEPFTAQSLENLKNQVIYFGSPLRFNDPYDCALAPRVNEPTDEEVETIRDHYLRRSDLQDVTRSQFQDYTTAGLREMLVRIGKQMIEGEIARFLSENGVSCFSERADSQLMWSHYAGHHKGFCLEFRTDSEPFRKIQQVTYAETMPACDLVPIICENRTDQLVRDLFCTKSIDWKYEREWRALHRETGTAYTYPAEALTGIYFGSEVSFASFEIVALVLAGQNENVRLWKGSRSKSTFSVEFEPVTYTPHLLAKQSGLFKRTEA